MLLEDHVQDTDPDETEAAINFDAAAAAQPGGNKKKLRNGQCSTISRLLVGDGDALAPTQGLPYSLPP